MASIDKAAIGVAVAVVVIFVGIAASMSAAQDAGPSVSAPVVSAPVVSAPVVSAPVVSAPVVSAPDEESEPKSLSIELEEKIVVEIETEEMETAPMEEAEPQTHSVEIPVGTSVPGCEETNSCYSPADITINAGDTVEWVNVDTAAHTVTGGSPTEGPSGVFDSSLVMADAVYAFTFDETGSYDYFCMVHPWMVGSVTVN